MATFPRTIMPNRSSPPMLPGPAFSQSHSGKLNTRSLTRIGWTWEEEFFFKWDTAGQRFHAQVEVYYRNAMQFDVAHQNLTATGEGGGTPRVDGADQAGQGIDTDGWTPSTSNVLTHGDFITFENIDPVYQIYYPSSSDGVGAATVYINPPIYAGNSPLDNDLITLTDSVVFKAKIIELEIPSFGPDTWVSMRIRWQEDV